MPAARLALTVDPLDVGDRDHRRDRVHEGPTGAIASFIGLVRGENLGRRVRFLEYEGVRAARAARVRADRAGDPQRTGWPATLATAPPSGRLEIGEASIAIVVASPHRAEGFAACRYAIERVKQIAPIWKHEHFEGGASWIEGATADPDDEGARAEALRRRVRVTVRLFARLREIAGAGELVLEVAAPATIGAVWPSSRAVTPSWQPYAAHPCRRRATWSTRAWTPPCRTATRWRSCRPCPAVHPAAASHVGMKHDITHVGQAHIHRTPVHGAGEPARRAPVQGDPSEYRKHASALADIEPTVERFREYKTVVAEHRAGAGALRSRRRRDASARPGGAHDAGRPA